MKNEKYFKCAVCLEVMNGNFSKLNTSQSPEECQIYHTIFYLEYCLVHNIIPDNMDVLIRSESTIVRTLCQKISILNGLPIKNLFNDPSYIIRAKYIEHQASLKETLNSIKDQNKDVKLAILKRLKNFVYSNKYSKDVYINQTRKDSEIKETCNIKDLENELTYINISEHEGNYIKESDENDIKESENDIKESENDIKRSENDIKISDENDIKESENDIKRSEIDIKESENDIKESENDIKESENDIKESENDIKESENDIKESEIDIKRSEIDIKISENDIKESENDIKRSENDIKESDENNIKELEILSNPEDEDCLDVIYGDYQEKILTLISDYINDKDDEVRLEFSRTLKYFSGCSAAFINKLFDKNKVGLFIYGAEDEIDFVRLEFVRAVELFANANTIKVIIEYLIDLLHDESEMVRRAVTESCILLSKKFELIINNEQLSYILDGLDQTYKTVKNKILFMICRFKYKTVDVFFQIIKQNTISDMFILIILKKVILRNKKLFYKNLDQFYQYSDDFNESKIFVNKSVRDITYIAVLLLLKILKKHFNIKLDSERLKDIEFLDLKMLSIRKNKKYKRNKKTSKKLLNIIKNNLKLINNSESIDNSKLINNLDYFGNNYNLINNCDNDLNKIKKRKILDSSICKKKFLNDAERFFDSLFFIISQYGNFPADENYKKLIYTFYFSDEKINSKFCQKMANSKNFLKNIYDIVKWIRKKKLYKYIRWCKYNIDIDNKIYLWVDNGIDFSVNLTYTHKFKNTYFVIENTETSEKIYYNLKKSITVVLNDSVTEINSYIEFNNGNDLLKLTDVKKTKFIKSFLNV